MCCSQTHLMTTACEIERTSNGGDADERRALRQGKEQAASRGYARLIVAKARNPLALLRGPEAYELHAQAVGRLRPLPRRWQDLLDGCAERALRGIALGKAQLDLRW